MAVTKGSSGKQPAQWWQYGQGQTATPPTPTVKPLQSAFQQGPASSYQTAAPAQKQWWQYGQGQPQSQLTPGAAAKPLTNGFTSGGMRPVDQVSSAEQRPQYVTPYKYGINQAAPGDAGNYNETMRDQYSTPYRYPMTVDPITGYPIPQQYAADPITGYWVASGGFPGKKKAGQRWNDVTPLTQSSMYDYWGGLAQDAIYRGQLPQGGGGQNYWGGYGGGYYGGGYGGGGGGSYDYVPSWMTRLFNWNVNR